MRPAAKVSPPWPFSQQIWSCIRNRVAIAGVFRVWFCRELVIAVGRLRVSGIQRPEAAIRSVRSSAAGDISASHSPPSEPKLFCGAK